MKLITLAGAVAVGLGFATSSFAANLTGDYLVKFSEASGSSRLVCFQLASTGAKKNYGDEGTVTSFQYPSYGGTYVTYKGAFYATFLAAGKESITITGKISSGTLITTAATEFDSTGTIDNIATLVATKGCGAATN